MEIFASYIPVVLIVLAIFAANWRTTVQFGHITMNMATKEDIREIKEEFRYMRDEMKDMRNDIRALDDRINRFENHVNQQFAEIREEISHLKRDVNTLQQSYVNHLITEHNIKPVQTS